MSHRVTVVTGPAYIGLKDNAIQVRLPSGTENKVPLEDSALLIVDGLDVTMSHQLLAKCAQENIAVVLCDEKFLPSGLVLPFSGHSVHALTLRQQIAASVPTRKRVWKEIVRAKLLSQGACLEATGVPASRFRKLAAEVRSGDPDNMEATGAAKYFPLVFGETFVRDRGLPGTNARLNYGYAVIRSAVARAVVGAGLMPALGIHHHNQYNHLALVDDAIEPFRAIVDFGVRKHFGLSLSEEDSPLTPSEKRLLVQLIGCCVMVDGKSTPFLVGLGSYAASLRRAICEGGALNVPTIDFKSL